MAKRVQTVVKKGPAFDSTLYETRALAGFLLVGDTASYAKLVELLQKKYGPITVETMVKSAIAEAARLG